MRLFLVTERFAEIEDCKFVEIGDVDKILQKVLKKYGVGGENEGK